MTALHFVACDADGTLRGSGVLDHSVWTVHQAITPELVFLEVTEAERLAIEAGPLTEWRRVEDEIVERESMAATASKTSLDADGEDLCTITGYPAGCTVTIRGVVSYGPAALADTTLEITLGQPGRVTVLLENAPVYRPWKVALDAA